jgi:hypothetical protein
MSKSLTLFHFWGNHSADGKWRHYSTSLAALAGNDGCETF